MGCGCCDGWNLTAVQAATGMPCRAAYTEKVLRQIGDPGKVVPAFIPDMMLKRFDLGEKPYVLLVEDVFTTGSTLQKTIKAIGDKHPDVRFHRDIGVIVNRSGKAEFLASDQSGAREFNLTSLITVNAQTWDSVNDLPEGMGTCTPVRPKGEWEKLTTEMLPCRQ